ncbi:hypothetical protein ABZ470_31105 [Streptosporangium sp. NPDC020072]|uniref:hypothetical protein n=1 Tax=Streptosporangium sp. NPDC020072 TaxID=3154788 RepID=UPI00343E97E4
MRFLFALLAAATVVPPVPAGAGVAGEPVIRSVTVTPGAPVVGPSGSVRVVIEVVAGGVAGPDGVTIEVEPGAPDAADEPASPPIQEDAEDTGVTGTADGQGASAPAPAPEWEIWRFVPDKGLTRWYPTGRWTVTVTARGAGGEVVTGHTVFRLRRETRFSAVRVAAGETGARVRGVLNRVDPQGYLDYAPFPGQPVGILHRSEPGEPWQSVASATTDAQGRFARDVPGIRDGQWRILFAGTGHYAGRRSIIHPTTA